MQLLKWDYTIYFKMLLSSKPTTWKHTACEREAYQYYLSLIYVWKNNSHLVIYLDTFFHWLDMNSSTQYLCHTCVTKYFTLTKDFCMKIFKISHKLNSCTTSGPVGIPKVSINILLLFRIWQAEERPRKREWSLQIGQAIKYRKYLSHCQSIISLSISANGDQ